MEKATASSNPFVVLSPFEHHNYPVLEEGEVQQSYVHKDEGEVNFGPQEHSGPVILEIPCADAILQELHKSPTCVTSSSSYVKILKNKSVDTSGSLEEDSIDKFTKKSGRKSRKEVIEEEAERLNMQGSHATIEMSICRSK